MTLKVGDTVWLRLPSWRRSSGGGDFPVSVITGETKTSWLVEDFGRSTKFPKTKPAGEVGHPDTRMARSDSSVWAYLTVAAVTEQRWLNQNEMALRRAVEMFMHRASYADLQRMAVAVGYQEAK